MEVQFCFGEGPKNVLGLQNISGGHEGPSSDEPLDSHGQSELTILM